MRRISPSSAGEADLAANIVDQTTQLARALVIGGAQSLDQIGGKGGEHGYENSGDERQHSPEPAIGFRALGRRRGGLDYRQDRRVVDLFDPRDFVFLTERTKHFLPE